jgi:hypothetical protein
MPRFVGCFDPTWDDYSRTRLAHHDTWSKGRGWFQWNSGADGRYPLSPWKSPKVFEVEEIGLDFGSDLLAMGGVGGRDCWVSPGRACQVFEVYVWATRLLCFWCQGCRQWEVPITSPPAKARNYFVRFEQSRARTCWSWQRRLLCC